MILVPPRLFILQFISNKTKVLTLFWDVSYHNTPIYHINKKNYNTTLQLHIKPHSKAVSNFHLCQLFTMKVYMPTVQFAEVPNKSSLSNNCCAFAIMFIYSTKKLRKSQKTIQLKKTKANNYSIFIYLFRYMSSVEKNASFSLLVPIPLLWHSVK